MVAVGGSSVTSGFSGETDPVRRAYIWKGVPSLCTPAGLHGSMEGAGQA